MGQQWGWLIVEVQYTNRMVKFTNKAKGRPSKRRTFKVKYKIEKKVKQHNKRVKKEAKKLKGKGLKHKGEARSDYLPNMFPFKQQILEEAKKAHPEYVPPEKLTLDQSEYGLVNLENKPAYLPKPKDNLIKKYVTNLDKLLENVSAVLELLEVRNPLACIDEEFRGRCREKNIKIFSLLTKTDHLKEPALTNTYASVASKCDRLIRFSTDHKTKSAALDSIIETLKGENVQGNVLVAGKSLTGKHAFITTFAKHLGKYNESPYELNLIKITPNILLIDSPFKIEDSTGYPLFHTPNPVLEESLFSQEEAIIKKLFFKEEGRKELFDHDAVLEHFGIQDYSGVSDFLGKVGKAWKIFGKGGKIDINRVRTKILSDWYTGKLTHLLHN